MTATGPGPFFVSKSHTFDIEVEPYCFDQVITPSVLTNQVYTVYEPLQSYTAPVFTNSDDLYCPLSYELFYDTSQSWLTPDVNGRKIEWQTDDNNNFGTQTITVKATGIDGITASDSFTIEVIVNCDN